MRNNIIILKPEGKSVPEDFLKNAQDANDLVFSAAYWKPGDKIKIDKLENDTYARKWWKDVEGHIVEPNKPEYTTVFFFGGASPAKNGCMPFKKTHLVKKKVDGKVQERLEYTYFWHSGKYDGLWAIAENDDYSCFSNVLEPLSMRGAHQILDYLKEKNGEFLTFSNVKDFESIRRIGKNWQEVDGIWYSNSDYKKKLYQHQTNTFAHTSQKSTQTGQTKNTTATASGDEEINWAGITFKKIGDGLRKYFGISPNYYYYIANINNSGYKERRFQLCDFVETVQGTRLDPSQLKKLINKDKRRFRYDAKILRINSLEWSRGSRKMEQLTIDLHNLAPNEEMSKVIINEAALSKEKILTQEQRRFVVIQLAQKYANSNVKNMNLQAWKMFLREEDDEKIIERAKKAGVSCAGILTTDEE